jgi:hypothetical protein
VLTINFDSWAVSGSHISDIVYVGLQRLLLDLKTVYVMARSGERGSCKGCSVCDWPTCHLPKVGGSPQQPTEAKQQAAINVGAVRSATVQACGRYLALPTRGRLGAVLALIVVALLLVQARLCAFNLPTFQIHGG